MNYDEAAALAAKLKEIATPVNMMAAISIEISSIMTSWSARVHMREDEFKATFAEFERGYFPPDCEALVDYEKLSQVVDGVEFMCLELRR